jgi:hypothetical protein
MMVAKMKIAMILCSTPVNPSTPKDSAGNIHTNNGNRIAKENPITFFKSKFLKSITIIKFKVFILRTILQCKKDKELKDTSTTHNVAKPNCPYTLSPSYFFQIYPLEKKRPNLGNNIKKT